MSKQQPDEGEPTNPKPGAVPQSQSAGPSATSTATTTKPSGAAPPGAPTDARPPNPTVATVPEPTPTPTPTRSTAPTATAADDVNATDWRDRSNAVGVGVGAGEAGDEYPYSLLADKDNGDGGGAFDAVVRGMVVGNRLLSGQGEDEGDEADEEVKRLIAQQDQLAEVPPPEEPGMTPPDLDDEEVRAAITADSSRYLAEFRTQQESNAQRAREAPQREGREQLHALAGGGLLPTPPGGSVLVQLQQARPEQPQQVQAQQPARGAHFPGFDANSPTASDAMGTVMHMLDMAIEEVTPPLGPVTQSTLFNKPNFSHVTTFLSAFLDQVNMSGYLPEYLVEPAIQFFRKVATLLVYVLEMQPPQMDFPGVARLFGHLFDTKAKLHTNCNVYVPGHMSTKVDPPFALPNVPATTPSLTSNFCQPDMSSWYSEIMIEIVNFFGSLDGFTKLFRAVCDTTSFSLGSMTAAVTSLQKINRGQYFSPRLKKMVAEEIPKIVIKLNSTSNIELSITSVEALHHMFHAVYKLMLVNTSSEESAQTCEPLFLNFAHKCLMSQHPQLTIYGLCSLSNMVSALKGNANSNMRTAHHTPYNSVPVIPKHRAPYHLTIHSMASWVVEHSIFSMVVDNITLYLSNYNAKYKHVQDSAHCPQCAPNEIAKLECELNYVEESLGFMVELLAEAHLLDIGHVDILFDIFSKKISEQFLPQVIGTVVKRSYLLSREIVDAIFAKNTSESPVLPWLQFTAQICQRSRNTSHMQTATDLFLRILLSGPTNLNDMIVFLVPQVFLIMNRLHWLTALIEQIQNKKCVLHCYKLITDIIKSYQVESPFSSTRAEMVGTLVNKHSLWDHFIAELNFFRSSWAAVPAGSQEYQSVYLPQLKQRLSFLDLLMPYATKPATSWLLSLWDSLSTSPAQPECDTLFDWVCSLGNQNLPSTVWCTLMHDLFILRCTNVSLFISRHCNSSSAFNCFGLLMVNVNRNIGKLDLTPNGQNYQVSCHFQDLLGYKQLWSWLTLSSEPALASQIITFLTELHSTVPPRTQQALHTCMDVLCEEIAGKERAGWEIRAGKVAETIIQLFPCPNSHKASLAQTRLLDFVLHVSTHTEKQLLVSHIYGTAATTLGALEKMISATLEKKGLTHSTDVLHMHLHYENGQLLTDRSRTLGELSLDYPTTDLFVTIEQDVDPRRKTLLPPRISFGTQQPQQPKGEKLAPDKEEQVQTLMDALGTERDLAIHVLKRNSWNVNLAANQLSDDFQRSSAEKELEQLKKPIPSTPSSSEPSASHSSLSTNDAASPQKEILLISAKYFNAIFSVLDGTNQTLCDSVWDMLCAVPTPPDVLKLVAEHKVQVADLLQWPSSLQTTYYLELLLLAISNNCEGNFEVGTTLPGKEWVTKFCDQDGLGCLTVLLHGETPSKVMSWSDTEMHYVSLVLQILAHCLNIVTTDEIESVGFDLRKVFAFACDSVAGIFCDQRETTPKDHSGYSDYEEELVEACLSIALSCVRHHGAFVSLLPENLLTPKVLHNAVTCRNVVISCVYCGVMEQLLKVTNTTAETVKDVTKRLVLYAQQDSVNKHGFLLLSSLLSMSFTSQIADPDENIDLALMLAEKLQSATLKTGGSGGDVGLLVLLKTLLQASETIKMVLCEEWTERPSLLKILFNNLFIADSNAAHHWESANLRTIAYSVLLELCKNSQENFTSLLGMIKTQNTFGEPRGWDHYPPESRAPASYAGLVNHSQESHINSVVQQLFMIPHLRKMVNAIPVTKNPISHLQGTSVVEQLQLLFSKLEFSDVQVCDAAELGSAYSVAVFNSISNNLDSVPNEPHEFYKGIIDRVVSCGQQTNLAQIFTNFFTASIKTTYVQHQSSSLSMHTVLSLHIPPQLPPSGIHTLESILTASITGLAVPGKTSVLHGIPHTLVMHLKRFDLNLVTRTYVKNSELVELPATLNLQNWTNANTSYDYQLVGVIVHSGTWESGHYKSYILERSSCVWYEFNDEIVTHVPVGKLPWNTKNQKECVDTILYERKNLLSMDIQNILSMSGADPHTTSIGVPEKIYREIMEDNQLMRVDRLLYSDQYFRFLYELCCIPHSYKFDVPTLQETVKLASTTVIEFLSHAKQRQSLCHWINLLQLLMAASPDTLVEFSTYIRKPALIKDILLNCPDEVERIRFVDLLAGMIKTLSAFGNLDEEAKTKEHGRATIFFMDNLFSLLEVSRESWKRSKQYFELPLIFASMGFLQRAYLMQNGIVSKYVDYILGDSPPPINNRITYRVNIWDNQNMADLRDLLATLSLLVRGCFQGPDRDAMTPYSLKEPLLSPDGLSPLWSHRFISQLLMHDFAVQVLSEIFVHMCWNDPGFSSYVNFLLLSCLSDNATLTSVSNFHVVIKNVLLVSDDLHSDRVQTLLSPFVSPLPTTPPHSNQLHNTNVKGILALLRTLSSTLPDLCILHCMFLLHMAESCASIFQFLSRNHGELLWMESFLGTYISKHCRSGSLGLIKSHIESLSTDAVPPPPVPPPASVIVAIPPPPPLPDSLDSCVEGKTDMISRTAIQCLLSMHKFNLSGKNVEYTPEEKKLSDQLEQLRCQLLYMTRATSIGIPMYGASLRWIEFTKKIGTAIPTPSPSSVQQQQTHVFPPKPPVKAPMPPHPSAPAPLPPQMSTAALPRPSSQPRELLDRMAQIDSDLSSGWVLLGKSAEDYDLDSEEVEAERREFALREADRELQQEILINREPEGILQQPQQSQPQQQPAVTQNNQHNRGSAGRATPTSTAPMDEETGLISSSGDDTEDITNAAAAASEEDDDEENGGNSGDVEDTAMDNEGEVFTRVRHNTNNKNKRARPSRPQIVAGSMLATEQQPGYISAPEDAASLVASMKEVFPQLTDSMARKVLDDYSWNLEYALASPYLEQLSQQQTTPTSSTTTQSQPSPSSSNSTTSTTTTTTNTGAPPSTETEADFPHPSLSEA
ncbi:Ubiquitin carboxyl-terminal hydrolase 34 [Pelomyxa schiedti]|nr:Ubiquitin carboxyl-terminal hydrolase 34 [Pelomyxa schiedti]